jgi:hypothetical protein
LDYYNGSVTQLTAFKSVTGVTYPLCRTASATGNAYGVVNDWSVVVDQQGLIRYKQHGVNVAAINNVIDQLLASSQVDENPENLAGFELHQNYPNPFNPRTTIRFDLLKPDRVTLRIYNALGQEVVTLVEQNFTAGEHAFAWNAQDERGRSVASGIYFYELKGARFTARKKMVLLQ